MGAEQGMGRNSLQSKRHNRGLVIGQLLTGACGSRIELARRTGLSKMTVTNIVADFIAQGMVEECEEQLTELGCWFRERESWQLCVLWSWRC